MLRAKCARANNHTMFEIHVTADNGGNEWNLRGKILETSVRMVNICKG